MNGTNFLAVLPYLLYGMLGVFFVTAILILCITLLNRVGAWAARKKDAGAKKAE